MRMTCRRCGADISGRRYRQARRSGLCVYCVRLVLDRALGYKSAQVASRVAREQPRASGGAPA